MLREHHGPRHLLVRSDLMQPRQTTPRDALGCRFGVTADDPDLVRHLEQTFSGLPPAPRAEVVFDMDSMFSAGTLDDGGTASLVGTVNLMSLQAAEGNLLLHGAAVARADGACVILCGPSGSGKTTLSAVLACGGYAYVTDETVCVDPLSFRITPYRKPLSIKLGSQGVLGAIAPPPRSLEARFTKETWFIPPSRLSTRKEPADLHPELLVFPRFRPTTRRPLLQRLHPADAAYRSGSNSSRLRQLEPDPLGALARLVRRIPAFSLEHGDVRHAALAVVDLLESA
jgi:hypothetical protein